MKQMYDSKYVSIELESTNSTLIVVWKPESINMTGDNLLKEGANIIKMALSNKVQNILGNNTEFHFAISPKMQEAMNNNILLKLNNSSVKKFAHVVSPEMLTQMSIEQMFDENTEKTFEDKYFDNNKEALDWCNK